MESSASVHEIPNILTDDERKSVLKIIKPLLIDGEDLAKQLGRNEPFPGHQTLANLHLNPDLKFLHDRILSKISYHLDLDLTVERSWAKWSNGKENQTNWHNHEGIPWSAVFYLKTVKHLNNGTQFRSGFVDVEPNSVLIFPGHLEHATPSHDIRHDRYVIAFDLIYER